MVAGWVNKCSSSIQTYVYTGSEPHKTSLKSVFRDKSWYHCIHKELSVKIRIKAKVKQKHERKIIN